MSDSVRPHRWQPTGLPHPWDSPGKNTEAGCHFLLQCTKVKSESEVTQSCPTLSDLMDCSLPGSSVHGIFQARVPEWGAIAFSGERELRSCRPLSAAKINKLCSSRICYCYTQMSSLIISKGEGNGTPLLYSCLGKPMDGGAW